MREVGEIVDEIGGAARMLLCLYRLQVGAGQHSAVSSTKTLLTTVDNGV